MAKHKERQALAVAARLSTGPVASFTTQAFKALEAEAARIVAENAEKRANGGVSGHIVATDGVISGFLKDKRTTVRFADGSIAVTTHE